MVKGKQSVKITEMNCQIQKLANDLDDDKPKYQIGFAIPTEEEEDANEDI